METEQQILRQKEIQAQQVVIDAKGKAEAAVASADGEARANQVRAAGITPQLIDYLRWTRWDGRLPLVSGESTPLVTLAAEATTAPPAVAPPAPTSQPGTTQPATVPAATPTRQP